MLMRPHAAAVQDPVKDPNGSKDLASIVKVFEA
jgi:hypothetical protein